MKTFTKDELKEILDKHLKWLRNEEGGERANLSSADLRFADLSSADLRFADLSFANLSSADLRFADLSFANLSSADLRFADLSSADLRFADLSFANLSSADLRYADLRSADLSSADLSSADLRSANLRYADLRSANLSYANLSSANLRYADLRSADLSSADLRSANLSSAKIEDKLLDKIYPIACPESGSFIAWKKAGGKIVKLEVCEDAKRSSAFTRKCRCSAAKVLAIENADGTGSGLNEIASSYDSDFLYKVGEIVSVPDFDEDRKNECAPGIHFFITRQEAVDW